MHRPALMRPALRLGLLLTLLVLALAVVGCATQQPEDDSQASAERSASIEPAGLWEDGTKTTIGTTKGETWTNKVELADANADGLVDVLFANGGDYETPGEPAFSQVFLNRGSGQMFEGATRQVFGSTRMLARVIKVGDVNADGSPDILVGTTYQTQSQLFFGDGSGNFTNVTKTHLPQIKASVGDLEFGDADGDGDLDVVLADWPRKPDGERRRTDDAVAQRWVRPLHKRHRGAYARRAGQVLLGARVCGCRQRL
jgi:hypothetical protein